MVEPTACNIFHLLISRFGFPVASIKDELLSFCNLADELEQKVTLVQFGSIQAVDFLHHRRFG
jgi:hypothetical protein